MGLLVPGVPSAVDGGGLTGVGSVLAAVGRLVVVPGGVSSGLKPFDDFADLDEDDLDDERRFFAALPPSSSIPSKAERILLDLVCSAAFSPFAFEDFAPLALTVLSSALTPFPDFPSMMLLPTTTSLNALTPGVAFEALLNALPPLTPPWDWAPEMMPAMMSALDPIFIVIL